MTTPSATPRHAVVIGAGLAGAAICAVLARRGWRLTLIDAAHGPAQAASALPVGMLSPHVTRTPTPLSRLSALGVAATRAELERLVPQGQGWQACEVDNLGHDPGRWPAVLARPSALVQAWLAEAQALTDLETRWKCPVSGLVRAPDGGSWTVLDAAQRGVATGSTVVVAAAHGSLQLLQASDGRLNQNTLPLRPVKGQMSLGPLATGPDAPRPQRNQGVFVPAYEDSGLPPEWPRRLWSMGSTYRRGENDDVVTQQDHALNLLQLDAMNPHAAAHMQQALASGSLLGWAQVRCASLDRLPLVGSVPDCHALQTLVQGAGHASRRIQLEDVPRLPGLFMLSALGSRGLTLAPWCAQMLAADMQGEQPEAEADLLRALDPARFAWKQARRYSSAIH